MNPLVQSLLPVLHDFRAVRLHVTSCLLVAIAEFRAPAYSTSYTNLLRVLSLGSWGCFKSFIYLLVRSSRGRGEAEVESILLVEGLWWVVVN